MSRPALPNSARNNASSASSFREHDYKFYPSQQYSHLTSPTRLSPSPLLFHGRPHARTAAWRGCPVAGEAGTQQRTINTSNGCNTRAPSNMRPLTMIQRRNEAVSGLSRPVGARRDGTAMSSHLWIIIWSMSARASVNGRECVGGWSEWAGGNVCVQGRIALSGVVHSRAQPLYSCTFPLHR
ncbi:hypothetical protein O3P69_016928 [Scylla paramamosain]|uniref:Uncharacterized protein n=1 Tax=Scylla paramamosain TaxID=85552 RepID=A0AAW0TTQ1_SCYPA